MKKILLLILTSLVLFVGCQKEDTESVANGPVTQKCTCPKCGAVYSVHCKELNPPSAAWRARDNWDYVTDPKLHKWIVNDVAGKNVPYYEYWSYAKMYFICTCGENSKEFNIEEFKLIF